MPKGASRPMQADYEYWAFHKMLPDRGGFRAGQAAGSEWHLRFFNQFRSITVRDIDGNKEEEEQNEGKPLNARFGQVINQKRGKQTHPNLAEPIIAYD